MQNFDSEVYTSKIDWWFFCAPFLTAMFFPLFTPVMTVQRDAFAICAAVFCAMLVVCAFLMYFGKNTKYALEAEGLRIYSPIFYNFFVSYAEIHSAEKSHNLLSAPAFSLSRIKIKFGKERKLLGVKIQPFALISPPDRDAFIAKLNMRIEAAKNFE